MKLALAMIVKGEDSEAEVFGRAIANASPLVDGIFITVTHKPNEAPSEKVIEVAKLFNANISHFEWVNDFAAARNFNFSQVPKEFDYILWIDADDVIRNGERIKELVEQHPADVYSLFYAYAFDEYKNPVVVHHKTRVIKNDGCVEWAGQLHEDFKENRKIIRYHIDGIDVLHMTDDGRFESAKSRNLEIAKGQLEKNPEDPRSYWNYANSLFALGNLNEAIEWFKKFMHASNSEDEKYIVRLRMAEAYWALDRKYEAIDEARYAVGMKPTYPDAFHLLGSLYFAMKRFYDAREMFLAGLVRKPPYYSIIVYNPRDYDYTPLMNLAKVYYNLSLPSLALECVKGCEKIYPEDPNIKQLRSSLEKDSSHFEEIERTIKLLKTKKSPKTIRRFIDSLPHDIRSHPAICNIYNTHFIKTESTGKDLVFVCGYTAEEWSPQTAMTKGIGGSEEAVINLSRELVKAGWNVTVYNRCGHKEKVYDGVLYKPFWSWNFRDKNDVTVIWRAPNVLDHAINSPKIYLDLHDTVPPGEFTDERLKRVTKILVKSNFHRSLYPNIPDEKFVVIPNGVNLKLIPEGLEKDQKLVINTSSADRSLSGLIRMWPKIKERVPDAKLVWAYGWHVFDNSHGQEKRMVEWKDLMKAKIEALPDFNEAGRLSHKEIGELYALANVFLYPTEFAEIHCISAAKAQAGGAIPVTTDFAALNETVQYGLKVPSKKTKDTWFENYQIDFSVAEDAQIDAMVDKVVELLNNPPSKEERAAMVKYARDTFAWERIASEWNKILCEI